MKSIKTLWQAARAKLREEYRKSFVVSLGLFLILVAACFLLIGRFLSARIHDRDAEAGLLRTRLEYRSTLIRDKDRIEKELAGLENNWLFMKAKVFTETSDDLALSHMQQVLDRQAMTRNLSIKSYKFGGTRRAGDFSVLPVSMEFSAKYEDVIQILNSIENHQYYLKVSDLEIRSFGQDENLQVRMVVEGYRYHEKAAS